LSSRHTVELKEFVRDALVQLISGISEAQAAIASTGARIAQTVAFFKQLTADVILDATTRRRLQVVEFDIAVAATQEQGRQRRSGSWPLRLVLA